MDCEMCGANARVRGKVEGVDMALCPRCAKHATNTRTISTQPKRAALKPATPAAMPHEPEMIESVHPDIAKILRSYREKHNLTQEEIARKLNIRISVYAHYEGGSTTPSIEEARRLERVVHTPLVVKIRIGSASSHAHTDAQGMTLGDLIKRK